MLKYSLRFGELTQDTMEFLDSVACKLENHLRVAASCSKSDHDLYLEKLSVVMEVTEMHMWLKAMQGDKEGVQKEWCRYMGVVGQYASSKAIKKSRTGAWQGDPQAVKFRARMMKEKRTQSKVILDSLPWEILPMDKRHERLRKVMPYFALPRDTPQWKQVLVFMQDENKFSWSNWEDFARGYQCANCGDIEHGLWACKARQCNPQKYFCSRECQKYDWKYTDHRKTCAQSK